MVYITTTKFLSGIPKDGNISVVVFYKNTDTVKLSEIAELIEDKSVDLSLVEIADRDDMLILLGGWFVNHDDDVTLLDSTIPVPKRYADRVTTVKSKASSGRKRGKKAKVDDDVESENVVDSESDDILSKNE